MAQDLRAHISLSEYPSSSPSPIDGCLHPSITSLPQDLMPYFDKVQCTVHKHKSRQNIHKHKMMK